MSACMCIATDFRVMINRLVQAHPFCRAAQKRAHHLDFTALWARLLGHSWFCAPAQTDGRGGHEWGWHYPGKALLIEWSKPA